MKGITIALMSLMLMAGIAPIVKANEGCPMCQGGKMADPGKKADYMAVMLDLNDKQKAEVQRLIEAKHKKMEPVMEQMKTSMNAAKDDFDAGIKKVLNEKQLKKYEAMKEKKEEKKH